jgi:hypothetical protein
VGDLNNDGKPDLVVTSNQVSDPVNVLLGNGDGTFQAGRQFDVGPGLNAQAVRPPVLADLTGNGIQDIVVPNFNTGDVSILLGRGDGTFAPERRFDATVQPDSVVVGDFNGDGIPDLAVLGHTPGTTKLAILLGRGDGTFLPPIISSIPLTYGDAYPVLVGDLTGTGKSDLVVFGPNNASFQVLLSNGDGTFRDGGIYSSGEISFEAKLADVTGNGKLDLVIGGANTGRVYVCLGNGNGTFQQPQGYIALTPTPGDNVGIIGLTVVDFGSPQGATGVGPADGHPDIVVTAQSRFGTTPPQLLMLPGLVDSKGRFAGFGTGRLLAYLDKAGKIAGPDLTGDGTTDVVMADIGGVRAFYSKPPTIVANTTAGTARDLGIVEHLVTQSQAIVTGHQDAYYTLKVPTEAAPGSGPEVLDFAMHVRYASGGGLQMTVLDANGNVLGSGARFRVVAAQGGVLTLHVSGAAGAGVGAYTLDVDVLPQIVSAQAQSALPGGPATSIVLTLQGDRLDPAAAENPANYTVTWFGPDGLLGTADDQVIPVAATNGAQPVVYNPGANIKVASGLTYPAVSRQTITLLFTNPLPAGSYQIAVASAVGTFPFNSGEAALLAGNASLGGHPIVANKDGKVTNGSKIVVPTLVTAAGTPNPEAITNGTPFLTQLQNDLGALVDALVRSNGDDPAITAAINNQILARFVPGYDPNAKNAHTFAIFWLDPVAIDLQTPQQGQQVSYNLSINQVKNNAAQTYVEVGGNVEVIVVAGVAGSFKLDVGDVGSLARGGAVVLAPDGTQTHSWTSDLRNGTTEFIVNVAEATSFTVTSLVNTATSLVNTATSLINPATTLMIGEAGTTVAASANGSSLAVLTRSLGNVADNVNGPVAEALITTLLVNVPGEFQATAPTSVASAPTATGGDAGTETGDVLRALQQSIDEIFLSMGEGGTAVLNASWDYAANVLDFMERAATPATNVLAAFGGLAVGHDDLPLRGVVRSLYQAGGTIATKLFGKRRAVPPVKAAVPATVSPPAVEPPAPEESDELSLWDPDPIEAPAGEHRSLLVSEYWPALLLVPGACLAWCGEVAREQKRVRTTPLRLPKQE